MILVDYSAVSIGAFVSGRVGADEKLLRHVILNNLRSYNLKHRSKYGEMILCMDSSSWRKDEFEWYKFRRKKSRDEDSTDWNNDIWPILNKISDEIKEYMPYRCIHVKGAEGDDCIAALTRRTQEFGKQEPVMIIASDKDYIQLQRYQNVKQWSTVTKKLVKADPHRWLVENIAKGQGKDGIPNIRTKDDFYTTEGGRQPPISKKLIDSILSEGPDKALDEHMLERWKQNEKILDFSQIPFMITSAILEEYDSYEIPPMRGVLNYLIKSGCGGLIDSINDFKPGKST